MTAVIDGLSRWWKVARITRYLHGMWITSNASSIFKSFSREILNLPMAWIASGPWKVMVVTGTLLESTPHRASVSLAEVSRLQS
ncbi:hypothetical protein RhiirA5_420441 [Rhizophagus irregularis]|uniref:Uncharacterized protein n=1 Tax=Rhizophagus irregularis TaxID=588596 RepID=A0A2N0PG44_9GLOM|nr:hypothetical protein RhiirA5_420441 [Rhizophagus irregularis]